MCSRKHAPSIYPGSPPSMFFGQHLKSNKVDFVYRDFFYTSDYRVYFFACIHVCEFSSVAPVSSHSPTTTQNMQVS